MSLIEDLIFINRTCPVLIIHPPLSATTVTASGTTSSVTSTYCMEEQATSLTPHTNEPPRRHPWNERKPKQPWRSRSNLDRTKDNPQPSDAPNLDTAGGRATPSTPRSASADGKPNDSSTPQLPRKDRPKPKPKPKPSGTLGIQEPGRDPVKANPPTNTSDSPQRRNQGKPDGGTTDASESKPPRRGNKTAPARKEPILDSETIHNSANVRPSSPKQGPSRRRRRGKVDGKLTTGDVETRQEERRGNPNREKHRVDYAADDLTSRLTHDLRTPPYLDCTICFNAIRPFEPTWSCSPSTPAVTTEDSQQAQYCWAILHLKCVRSWASKSIADLRQAYKARGEDKPGEWLCPGCRSKRRIEPSSYRYALRWSPLIQH
jgi:transcriptional repressor NF-X1